jgi:DNA modification methylase
MNGEGLTEEIIRNWKSQRNGKPKKSKKSTTRRTGSAELILGDCRKKLEEIPTSSIDAIITDPIYPEVKREYGKISEDEWLEMMAVVIEESKRVLKPNGSAVFILQPNFDKIGKMRLWLWKFIIQAAEQWNLVQDCYWWAIDTLPSGATNRKHGLMRQSVKTCIWLGSPTCYRNQDAVLWEESEKHSTRKWSDRALQNRPSGYTVREGRTAQTSAMRGGTVPFNLLPIPNANTDDTGGHPASTPYDLAAWWCRYILPPKGVLLDMFCGSGTMLAAGLDNGASKVIGIEKERKYLDVAKKRVL